MGTKGWFPRTIGPVAEQMVNDGFVVDAFTLERLHIRAKSIATHCKNIGQYEGALMGGIVNTHLAGMAEGKQWSSNCHLLPPVAAMPWSPNILVADKAEYFGYHFKIGNFVWRGGISVVVVVVGAISNAQTISWAKQIFSLFR